MVTLEDISTRVGLTAKGYGQGVTTADYDGDGDCDIYVTRYGCNTLWAMMAITSPMLRNRPEWAALHGALEQPF